MRVLGVGGCSSGVGKTSLICRLLESLPGWGALKTTPVHRRPCPDPATCPACHGLEGRWQIRTDPAYLLRERSDTFRYREAGAARIAWLKSRPDDLGAGIEEAIGLFSGLPGVLVEGNSFTRHLSPHRLAIVARAGLREIKPSALALLGRADTVLLNHVPPPGVEPEASGDACRRLLAAGARAVHVLDVSDPLESGCRAFLEEIRAWARR
jgi:hypothetical protein